MAKYRVRNGTSQLIEFDPIGDNRPETFKKVFPKSAIAIELNDKYVESKLKEQYKGKMSFLNMDKMIVK